MITYAINLCTDTKNTDRYDKVAVNKYPVLIKCKNDDVLREILSNNETNEFVKEHIKLKHLYENSVFYIRRIEKNNIKDFYWIVKEIVKVNY